MFYYRLAAPGDLDAIMALLENTSNAIEDKNLFVADDRDFVRRHIGGAGEILLAAAGEEAAGNSQGNRGNTGKCQPVNRHIGNDTDTLAGFLMLRFPEKEADNLGRDMGLNDRELLSVVHMESAAVAQRFRGRKIMQKLIARGEALAQSRGYTYAMCTVSPDNPWSLSNMLACGYEIVKTCQKYGGRQRHILFRRLTDEKNEKGEELKL